jgi:hypothetical protein
MFKYNKWYFNKTKTGLYFIKTIDTGFGFRANTHTWFVRSNTGWSIKWDVKDLIPATKDEVSGWLTSVPNTLGKKGIIDNLKIAFPDDNPTETDTISRIKNIIKTGNGRIILFRDKNNVHDNWTKIPPILFKILSNLDTLDFRIEPDYSKFKKGDPVVIKFENDENSYIRVFAGLNINGNPMVFDHNINNNPKPSKPIVECRKFII